jgi:hypothetical protein
VKGEIKISQCDEDNYYDKRRYLLERPRKKSRGQDVFLAGVIHE